MFRREMRWSPGIVRHEGRKIEITVPAPTGLLGVGGYTLFSLIFLPILFGVAYLALSGPLHVWSLQGLLRVSIAMGFWLILL